MYKNLIPFILFFWLLFLSNTSRAQYQNQVVKDLKSTWKTYDKLSGYFVPFIDTNQAHTIYFELDLNPYKKFNLELSVPSRHSIYIDDQLVYVSDRSGTVVWAIDSLTERYKRSKIVLTIFNDDLKTSQISSYIAKKQRGKSGNLESTLIWDFRHRRHEMNVLTLSSFIILSLIVIYRTTSYRLFSEYFSIRKAMMVRQRFDLIGAHSPISPVTLVFSILYALMVGGTFLHLKLISLWSMDYIGWARLSEDPIVYGAQITIAAFLFMILKYPLIVMVTGIFNFQKYSDTHYFAYLRISLIAILIVLVSSITLSILSDQWMNGAWFIVRFIIAILMLVRLFYMALILNNKYNFSKLHLFTYLCSSEIIPLCLFVKSVLG